MTTFTELGLDPALLKALESEGYTTPTPIQLQAIPNLLAGKDLLGIAQTGTGKTAAFALPILQRLAADRKPAPRNGARALILSPTRELASQIAESFKTYGKHYDFSVAVIFGGVGYKPQTNALQRGIDILVATPGRLIDHMEERNANLSTTEILVLDEADQMMDLGFIRPLRQIISKLPSRRQSMFFSATMPHEIGALAAELLRDPVKVSVTPAAKTADRVEQKVIFVEGAKKRALLVELMADAAMTRTLVFTRTKRGADKVAKHLETSGIPCSAIHGNKSQGQREFALQQFKSSKIRALIATDIAARGIDIDNVSHVVNYELPNVPESYVHRIGRTARAGAEGIALSFCDGEERAYLKDIERLTRQQIPSTDRRGDAGLVAPVEDRSANARPESGDRRNNGGNRGGRGGGGRDRNEGGRSRPERFAREGGRTESGNGHAHRAEPKRDRGSERPPYAGQQTGPFASQGERPRRDERPARADGHRFEPKRDRGGERPQHAGQHTGHTERPRRDERPARADGQRPERSEHRSEHRNSDNRRPDNRNGDNRSGDNRHTEGRRSDGPRSAEHRHSARPPHAGKGDHPRRTGEHGRGRPHNERSGGGFRRNEDRGGASGDAAENGGLSNVAFLAGGRREGQSAKPHGGKPHSGKPRGAKPHGGPRRDDRGGDRRPGARHASGDRPNRHPAD